MGPPSPGFPPARPFLGGPWWFGLLFCGVACAGDAAGRQSIVPIVDMLVEHVVGELGAGACPDADRMQRFLPDRADLRLARADPTDVARRFARRQKRGDRADRIRLLSAADGVERNEKQDQRKPERRFDEESHGPSGWCGPFPASIMTPGRKGALAPATRIFIEYA